MVYNVSLSAGDTVVYDSNTPGGYTFQQHLTNATSINKIKQGDWDFVVLQEQSQLPSFPLTQVEVQCFPYAKQLNDSILTYNSCAETVFYMTWGRKNGDAGNCGSFPPLCTYEGMDSLLHLRYMMMADSNAAIVSPVGAVWHYVRNNFPSIELYQTDESHPSLAGSYIAACTFYTILFRKSPLNISNDYGLSAGDALSIKNAVKTVVYDSLSNWHIGEYDLSADFSYNTPSMFDYAFTNQSNNATGYFWDFGDGFTSTLENPTHTYTSIGQFTVSLISNNGCASDTSLIQISIHPGGIKENTTIQNIQVYPNPAKKQLTIEGDEIQTAEIFNLLGKAFYVKSQRAESKIILNIEDIPQGVYFIKISTNKNTTTKRIVKN